MGFWKQIGAKEINNAKSAGGGLYFVPGNYVARIQRCRMFQTRKGDDAFIAEFEVVSSDNDKLKPGTQPSYYVEVELPNSKGELSDKGRMGLGNVVDFVRAGLASMAEASGEAHDGIENIEVDDETMEQVSGEDNLLAGTLVQIYAYNKPTKKGADFTRFKWSVPANVTELAGAQ